MKEMIWRILAFLSSFFVSLAGFMYYQERMLKPMEFIVLSIMAIGCCVTSLIKARELKKEKEEENRKNRM